VTPVNTTPMRRNTAIVIDVWYISVDDALTCGINSCEVEVLIAFVYLYVQTDEPPPVGVHVDVLIKSYCVIVSFILQEEIPAS